MSICSAIGDALAWLPAVLAAALVGDALLFVGGAMILRRKR